MCLAPMNARAAFVSTSSSPTHVTRCPALSRPSPCLRQMSSNASPARAYACEAFVALVWACLSAASARNRSMSQRTCSQRLSRSGDASAPSHTCRSMRASSSGCNEGCSAPSAESSRSKASSAAKASARREKFMILSATTGFAGRSSRGPRRAGDPMLDRSRTDKPRGRGSPGSFPPQRRANQGFFGLRRG